MTTYTAQTTEIETKRTDRQIIPVRLHHTPVWLAKRLRKRFGLRKIHNAYIAQAAADAVAHGLGQPYRAGWLDHWGTAIHDGQECFVSEPYGNDLTEAKRFAEIGGFELENHGKRFSWWLPDSTTRLVFRPLEDIH